MTIHSDPQLNDADLELLSAYIDRQLGDRERAALEQRLSQEPALRSALDELRATVSLLHELEPLRPPRSFAIAAPAATPRRIWSFSWPAIGSALVALVCMLTFGYALIRSSSSSGGLAASGAPPAAMQEAAAPTAAAAAAGGAAPSSAMREAATQAPAPAAAAPMAAPAAAAPTAAAAAEPPETAADQATAAPAAAASVAAPAEATAAPAAAAEASTATPAPTAMPAAGVGAIATAEPAAPALPQAADSAAPAEATPAAGAAPKTTDATVQQPYSALVATSEISSPGTITLEQPPVAPVANTAPSNGLNTLGLVAGAVVLALLIGAGVWFAQRRKRS